MTGDLVIRAEIVTVDGGRCIYRPVKWRNTEKSERTMMSPIDRDIVKELIDDLYSAAENSEERVLKIREGIIRGVEPA